MWTPKIHNSIWLNAPTIQLANPIPRMRIGNRLAITTSTELIATNGKLTKSRRMPIRVPRISAAGLRGVGVVMMLDCVDLQDMCKRAFP